MAAPYFAGTEDISWSFLGGTGGSGNEVAVSTDPSYFRSAWSRCSIGINRGVSSQPVYPPTTRIEPALSLSSLSSLWLHFQCISPCSQRVNEMPVCGFRSPDGVWRLFIVIGDIDGDTHAPVSIVTQDSLGNRVTLATSSATAVDLDNLLQPIDVEVEYGTSGSVAVYLNQSTTAAVSYTGNVTTDGATTLNNFFLSRLSDGANIKTYFSECILHSQDTRGYAGADAGLYTMEPDGAGDTQEWTGAVSDINEVTLSDATIITSSTQDEASLWVAPTTYFPSMNGQIAAFILTLRGKSTSGEAVDYGIKPADGVLEWSSYETLTTSFAYYDYVWTENPTTDVDWEFDDFDFGFNFGLRNSPY